MVWYYPLVSQDRPLVLDFVLSTLTLAWLDPQQVCLSSLQLTQSQQGFAADVLKAGLYPEILEQGTKLGQRDIQNYT